MADRRGSAVPAVAPVRHLQWAWEQGRCGVRVGRSILHPERRGGSRLHDHDFCEFMFIDSGRCEHLLDGRIETLGVGDYRCLRPADAHRLRSDGRPCGVVNIAFGPEALAGLRERCGEDWLWPESGPPRGGRLSAAARERLPAWLDVLSSPDLRRIDVDAFILDLTRLLTAENPEARAQGLPTWLVRAIEVFSDPRHLRGGVAELSRLCGRSREHINRLIRHSQGRRATDLVNALRMDWISSQLRQSDEPIEDLAAACGLPNQAHFYRVFRSTFGETPAAFRRSIRARFPRRQGLNFTPWVRE